MKRGRLILLLVSAMLLSGACTSSDSDGSAAPGTREAFCPVLVEMVLESARAGAAVGDDAGPNVVNGPEFARTRELLGDLIEEGPEALKDLVQAASIDPSSGEEFDQEAGAAMWTAIADLGPDCAGAQPAACTHALREVRGAASVSELDEVLNSLGTPCSIPDYLDGPGECPELMVALLLDDADAEVPVLERSLEACTS